MKQIKSPIFLFYLFFSLVAIGCNETIKKSKKISTGDTTKAIDKKIKIDSFSMADNLIDSIEEDKIYTTVLKLPEVKSWGEYLEKQTKGKRHEQVWIYEKPTLENKYYWVKVGEDNGDAYVSHFDFFVYPPSLTVKYFDTLNDTAITLKKWRKEKKY